MSDQRVEDGALPRVAVLCGSDVERLVVWDNFIDLDGTGNNDSWRLIDAFGQQALPWSRIHLTPRYFRQLRHAVLAIRARIPLEYCGLDACLAEDGRVVVFEANATMNVWPHFNDPTGERIKIVLKPMLDAVRRLILAKAGQSDHTPRADLSMTQAQP